MGYRDGTNLVKPFPTAAISPSPLFPLTRPAHAAVLLQNEVSVNFRILILIALTLVGCGNADMGAEAKREQARLSAANATASRNLGSSISLTNCHTMTPYNAGNTAMNAFFQNANVCQKLGNAGVVQLRVSAQTPNGARMCLVPVISDNSAAPESCFAINGTLIVTLNSSYYISLVLVAESDVTAYKNALAGRSATIPTLAFASML